LAADKELAKHPEVQANVLTRVLSLQRRALADDDQDLAVGLVLLRLDLVLSSGTRSADAVNARVRLTEQIAKLRGALRRAGGGRAVPEPPPSPLWQTGQPGGPPRGGEDGEAA
jgi:hypothetical protein